MCKLVIAATHSVETRGYRGRKRDGNSIVVPSEKYDGLLLWQLPILSPIRFYSCRLRVVH